MKVQSTVFEGRKVVIVGRRSLIAERRKIKELLEKPRTSSFGDTGAEMCLEIGREKHQAVFDFIETLLVR